jgi:hypothetical protein
VSFARRELSRYQGSHFRCLAEPSGCGRQRHMTGSPAYVCSMCRKPIAVGGKVIRCSVSTCNSGKIKLVFCSAACWDSHLPDARHRSAYFVEEIARRQ